jgi:hypothetical protein
VSALTRRGLLGWLGALVGAGAVAKVAPAEATEEVIRFRIPHAKQPWTEPTPEQVADAAADIRAAIKRGSVRDFKREFGVRPSGKTLEHGLTLTAGGAAFILNPARDPIARERS